jgi:hypothetical protein
MKPDSAKALNRPLPSASLMVMRQRTRALQLLEAAERAGIAPMRSNRLHAFAYLADVLSPVWNLPAFDGKILKIEGGPHYPDLQRELDRLVVLGMAVASGVRYTLQPNNGARIDAFYSLNLGSPKLIPILDFLGAGQIDKSLDERDFRVHSFLRELAGALATVSDAEIEIAASVDATYADKRVGFSNIIDFGDWSTDIDTDNLSLRTVEHFYDFLPDHATLTGGEKLYLYASFLKGRIHAE